MAGVFEPKGGAAAGDSDASNREAELLQKIGETLDPAFCVEALQEALSSFGRPEIFNTDQGAQFTAEAFTDVLHEHARTVQADGTDLLSFIERAGGRRPGCWSHGRRGLVLCARSGDRVALDGVRLLAPLFEVERESKLAGDNAAQRKERRQKKSEPVTESIFAWVDEQRALVPPKTALGRALGYLHRQRNRLLIFLDDGNVALTNNRRERELRKPVLGRRNWLFAWKDVGGERLASILTILNTAVAHGLNPRTYLVIVTEGMLNGRDVAELLPDRITQSHPELRIPRFEEPHLPD